MRCPLVKAIDAADCRYVTNEEEETALIYADSLPRRFETAHAVRNAEDMIVEDVLDFLKTKYPKFAEMHDRAWDRGRRDMQLVLRYTVQGMLLDDIEMASEKLFYWLRTIFASFGFTTDFTRDSYARMIESCRERIAPEAFAILEPHLNRTLEVLSDYPEPAFAAV